MAGGVWDQKLGLVERLVTSALTFRIVGALTKFTEPGQPIVTRKSSAVNWSHVFFFSLQSDKLIIGICGAGLKAGRCIAAACGW